MIHHEFIGERNLNRTARNRNRQDKHDSDLALHCEACLKFDQQDAAANRAAFAEFQMQVNA